MSAVRVDRRGGRIEVLEERGEARGDWARFRERVRVRRLSRCTVEAYGYDLALVHRWLSSARLQLAALSTEEVHRFLAWERGRASHPKSLNRRLHTLRLFYRFVLGT